MGPMRSNWILREGGDGGDGDGGKEDDAKKCERRRRTILGTGCRDRCFIAFLLLLLDLVAQPRLTRTQ